MTERDARLASGTVAGSATRPDIAAHPEADAFALHAALGALARAPSDAAMTTAIAMLCRETGAVGGRFVTSAGALDGPERRADAGLLPEGDPLRSRATGGVVLAPCGTGALLLAIDADIGLPPAALRLAADVAAVLGRLRPDGSAPLRSGPVASEPAASGPAASEPAASGPAASEPAASEPAPSGPAATGADSDDAPDRLREQRDEARQRIDAKNRMIATLSHEIRTPLSGMLGMAELLEPEMQTDRQRDMLATIRGSGDLLTGMLNDLLDLSKLEAGQLGLSPAPFVPRRLCETAVRLYEEQAKRRGIALDLLVSPGADTPRLGDAHRLRQILQNLLGNALKFTESGAITVTLSARPGKPMTLEVADTGIGMSETQLATVFDPYRQAEQATATRFGGTGLGLSIVRELVTLMQGRIEADSRKDDGTRIRIHLPLPEAPDTRPDRAPRSSPPPDLRGARILLADDSPTNLSVLSSMLDRAGAANVPAADGPETIEIWAREADAAGAAPFDLLLLDIAMPRMDGAETLAALRRLEAARGFRPTPAAAVTANVMPDQVAGYVAAGFDGVLPKPFRGAALHHLAETLLAAPVVLPPGRCEARRGGATDAVLVADDDPVAREILSEFLKLVAPFEIVEASDGFDALLLALTRPFGLIVADLRMPRIPGDRLIRALRVLDSPSRSAGMVLSTGSLDAARPGSPAAGEPDLFLPKPVRPDLFQDTVARLTGRA